MAYVAEVPRSFRCLTVRPRRRRPSGGGKGPRAAKRARCSASLNRQPGPGVPRARLPEADPHGEVRAGPVYRVRRGRPTEQTSGLIGARNVATGAVQYFVSHARRVACRRGNGEPPFGVRQTAIGFGPFEGRNYVALLRHRIRCMLGMGLGADQTERRRGEQSGDHPGAGVSGLEAALRGLAGESPGDIGVGASGRGPGRAPAA